MPVNQAQTPKPVSILKRVCLSTLWTVFGLVFFYLVMVLLSSLATGIVLDRLPQNGWARSASRHTAAVTAPVFALFLMSNPASLWSLFLSVMVACAHFCHFVIITSDLRVYVDHQLIVKMFRTERTHPLFRLLPLHTAHVVGTVGFAAILVVCTERCYGACLRTRQPTLPPITRACCAWIWAVFTLFFVDRLAAAIMLKKSQQQVLYPIAFLGVLALGAAQCALRETRCHKLDAVQAQKKVQ